MHIRVIAEAGVNHNGSLECAKLLARAAKDAGADMVKYQTYIPELLVTASAAKAEYQKRETAATESQLEMLRRLSISFDEFRELKAYCESIGIAFLSTAFDLLSADFLNEMECTLWKIPSGEVTNLPLLRKIAGFHQEILLSTGMCRMEEVEDAINVIQAEGCDCLTLLHCTTAYPAPFDQINLRAMDALAERFGLPVGYSDHSAGMVIPIAAAARGATVVEKHFTLDRGMEGPDHRASLEPQELADMVRAIREVEESLGNGIKEPTPIEMENMKVARKSIVANCAIKAGELFTAENLTVKRPGGGISPMYWDTLIGKKASRNFAKDELICL